MTQARSMRAGHTAPPEVQTPKLSVSSDSTDGLRSEARPSGFGILLHLHLIS
jgi:hypothetical protein